MSYPIFDIIVREVKNELQRQNITFSHSKRWTSDEINATGLELQFELEGVSDHIQTVIINFDWDKFKELTLAKNLAFESHPLLLEQEEERKNANDAISLLKNVNPGIEVEVTWKFDPSFGFQTELPENMIGDQRLKEASKWMKDISHDVNTLLNRDRIISRWHIDVSGDIYGKYISEALLMAYFFYDLSEIKTLDEIVAFSKQRIRYLIYKTNKVLKIASTNLDVKAA